MGMLLLSKVSHAEWPLDGRAVWPSVAVQFTTSLVPDGTGGAIIVWADRRSGGNDVYSQHILPSGEIDPSAPLDGRAVCAAAFGQGPPVIAPDGKGGAVVTW